jgi:predicted trehalose synthase
MTKDNMTLNWKSRGDGRYEALASRIVGGKYFIQWEEGYYSNQAEAWIKTARYSVDYQTKGGGGIGNVDQSEIHTLEAAKALAEAHHQKHKALIAEYGELCNVPDQAWSQFNREMLALQGYGREAP